MCFTEIQSLHSCRRIIIFIHWEQSGYKYELTNLNIMSHFRPSTMVNHCTHLEDVISKAASIAQSVQWAGYGLNNPGFNPWHRQTCCYLFHVIHTRTLSCLRKQIESMMHKHWHCKTIIQNCHNKILTSASLASRISVHDTLARVHKALKFWSATFICFRETNAPLCNWHTTLHKKNKVTIISINIKSLFITPRVSHSVRLPWILLLCHFEMRAKKQDMVFFNLWDYGFKKILPLSNMNTTTIVTF